MKTLTKVALAIALITLFSSCQSGSDVKQVLSKSETRKEIMDTIANNSSMSKEMMESMMNNTPLLISNKTGLTNYLKDGYECFKFDSNADSIALLFKKVEKNMDKQEQMGINARNTFSSIFSVKKYCDDFSKIIS